MARQLLRFLLFLLPLLFFVHCAQVGQLTGGKRDLMPPKLVEAVPLNGSTAFNSEKIILRFDEFVQLKDLNSQLVVSPKLKTRPEVEADGKTINIRFKKSELAPNTTYKIYLGQAVADMNEVNAIPNFEYVFSTGKHLDSLKIEATATDAFNNKPLANAIIALYENKSNEDSLPYKEIPDYLGKSDQNGKFIFDNLPHRSFKVYAYNDRNKNYLYDGESEQIGFLNNNLILQSDTSVHLQLFQEESSKGFIKRTFATYYGLVQIMLNRKSMVAIETLKATDRENIFETLINKEKDTISVYYRNITDTLGLILRNLSQKKSDTLRISLPKKNPIVKKFKGYTLNNINNSLVLGTRPTISFLNWMDILTSDVKKMKLSSPGDSAMATTPVTGNWIDITHFEITSSLKEGVDYRLKIDTNAFFDTYGVSNDSASFNFKTQSTVEFGNVTLKMLFQKKQAYVIQLLNDKEQVVKQSFTEVALSASNAVSVYFKDIQPGSYSVKVILDDNKNKKWDSGNLFLKRQPEHVIISSKQIKILADWEVEEEILVKE